jgi:hypothetical protein
MKGNNSRYERAASFFAVDVRKITRGGFRGVAVMENDQKLLPSWCMVDAGFSQSTLG